MSEIYMKNCFNFYVNVIAYLNFSKIKNMKKYVLRLNDLLNLRKYRAIYNI